MKKIFLFLSLLIATSSVFAQYPGYPLFGTSAGTDRTYRSLQLGATTISDTLGSTIDTIPLLPGFVSGAGAVFSKNYILNLKDSCVLAIALTSSSYQFSEMTIYINAPAIGGRVRFLGFSGLASQWALTAANTSISPTASHWFIIKFLQIGSVWAEISQSQD